MLDLAMHDRDVAVRFFNTAGPMKPDEHYCIPPLSRLNQRELLTLIRQQRYFVLHAPRQTGKTSALLALVEELNGSGAYRCVYVNVETGQSAREDVAAAMRAILNEIARAAEVTLEDRFPAEIWPEVLERAGPHDCLRGVLARWAAADAKPLVLLIDEIDALIGDTLIAVLRQLRSGYAHRPRRRRATDPAPRYVGVDGGLLAAKLLTAFQEFVREHSEHWVQRFQYREAGPQLLLQAFLQRIVNSGGLVQREYGLGSMRTDLLITWPADAPPGTARKTVIECKVVHPQRGLEATVREGLEQTRAYLQRCTAAEGHLVIFDRRPERTWEDKIFRRDETEGGAPVTVWGM